MFAEKKNNEDEEQTEDKLLQDDNECVGKQNKKTMKRKAEVNESESDDMKGKSKRAKRRKDGSSSTISDALETSHVRLRDDRDEVDKSIGRGIQKEICEKKSGHEAQRDGEKDCELSGGDDVSDGSKRKERKRWRSETSDDEMTTSKRNKESLESEDVSGNSSKRSDCETNAQGSAGEVGDACKKKKKRKRKRKRKEKQKVEVPQLRVISKYV